MSTLAESSVPSNEAAAAPAETAYDPTQKQKSQAKTARIPIKIIPAERLKKPEWIRVKAAQPGSRFYDIKRILREHNLHTVCEEASCPNIGECFGKGTATFMIMGDKCTRRCPFCDVGHGRPDPLDTKEPENLARTIAARFSSASTRSAARPCFDRSRLTSAITSAAIMLAVLAISVAAMIKGVVSLKSKE